MAPRVPSAPRAARRGLSCFLLSFSLSLPSPPGKPFTGNYQAPVPGSSAGGSECGQQLEKGEADMENLLQVLGSSGHKRDNQTRACGLGATLWSPQADCEGGDDFSGAKRPVCLGRT